jgi:hypothetical protein
MQMVLESILPHRRATSTGHIDGRGLNMQPGKTRCAIG